MTQIQKTITKGQLFAEKQLGYPTLTWNGQELLCVPSTAGKSYETGFGINGPVTTVNFTVRLFNYSAPNNYTSVFDANLPKKPDAVVFRDVTYKIEQVRMDSSESTIRFLCESPNKGAAIRS